jgi:hypothetical protein
MEMGFATLQPGTTKDTCEAIAVRWTRLLSTGAVAVKAYSIEDDKILLGVEGGYADMFKVKEFVLEQVRPSSWYCTTHRLSPHLRCVVSPASAQPEATEFEWQQQKFHPKPKGGKKAPSKVTPEQRAAQERAEKELELRRKIESGELAPPPRPGQAQPKAAAKPAKPAPKAAKADDKAKAKPKAAAKADAKPEAKKPAPKTEL